MADSAECRRALQLWRDQLHHSRIKLASGVIIQQRARASSKRSALAAWAQPAIPRAVFAPPARRHRVPTQKKAHLRRAAQTLAQLELALVTWQQATRDRSFASGHEATLRGAGAEGIRLVALATVGPQSTVRLPRAALGL